MQAFLGFPWLESDGVGAPVGVVHGADGGRRHAPLVPHVLLAAAPPEVHLHDLAGAHRQRLAQGEQDGEPGEHAAGMGLGLDAQEYVLVQSRFEVPAETVTNVVLSDLELHRFISGVINYLGSTRMFECE